MNGEKWWCLTVLTNVWRKLQKCNKYLRDPGQVTGQTHIYGYQESCRQRSIRKSPNGEFLPHDLGVDSDSRLLTPKNHGLMSLNWESAALTANSDSLSKPTPIKNIDFQALFCRRWFLRIVSWVILQEKMYLPMVTIRSLIRVGVGIIVGKGK